MILYLKRPFHSPHFKINCNEKVAAALKLQYGKYIGETPVSDTYDINADKNCQHILYDIDCIIYEQTKYDSSVLALHGAAVEWRGKAYVFLAATASGKTTLTSYLTNRGFGYITDDCVLINRVSFNVFPYNCPIQLRGGGLDALKKNGKAPENLQLLDDEIMGRYIFMPENCVTETLPLSGIFFINRTETENKTIELTVNERIAKLMKSPITAYTPDADYLRLIAKLSQKNCYKLLYENMDFVAETIMKAGEAHG